MGDYAVKFDKGFDRDPSEPQTARRKSALLRAVTLDVFGTQKGAGENCGKRRDAIGERESCVGSSVISHPNVHDNRSFSSSSAWHPPTWRLAQPLVWALAATPDSR